LGWDIFSTLFLCPVFGVHYRFSLEREAFDARLNLTPTVPTLDDVHVNLEIKDEFGSDASDLFFVVVTQNSNIGSLE
jgi:hypothetical protein